MFEVVLVELLVDGDEVVALAETLVVVVAVDADNGEEGEVLSRSRTDSDDEHDD